MQTGWAPGCPEIVSSSRRRRGPQLDQYGLKRFRVLGTAPGPACRAQQTDGTGLSVHSARCGEILPGSNPSRSCECNPGCICTHELNCDAKALLATIITILPSHSSCGFSILVIFLRPVFLFMLSLLFSLLAAVTYKKIGLDQVQLLKQCAPWTCGVVIAVLRFRANVRAIFGSGRWGPRESFGAL